MFELLTGVKGIVQAKKVNVLTIYSKETKSFFLLFNNKEDILKKARKPVTTDFHNKKNKYDGSQTFTGFKHFSKYILLWLTEERNSKV